MDYHTRIAIIGTGVVGQGVLKTWHERGFQVSGYDVNAETISKLVSQGYDVHPMDSLIDCTAELVFVCISTPQSNDGSIFLEHMRSGLKALGPWIAKRVGENHYPMIVMRSTMLPKLSETEIIPRLEKHSGLKAGEHFGYAHMPEILRETDALEDELNIWQVVIGALDQRTADALVDLVGPYLGDDREKLMTVVPVAVAEASKIIVNTYNATIISYFNQMWMFLKELDIDGQAAIDLSIRMCEGALNRWYGTAGGYPYGGKCLPKDVAATLAMAREQNVRLTQLEGTQAINDLFVEQADKGVVPKPIIGGFRRLNAHGLRLNALSAYEQLFGTQRQSNGSKQPALAPSTPSTVGHTSKNGTQRHTKNGSKGHDSRELENLDVAFALASQALVNDASSAVDLAVAHKDTSEPIRILLELSIGINQSADGHHQPTVTLVPSATRGSMPITPIASASSAD